ncbi:DNA polymerase III subunit alpha [Clostridium botulinum]|uniref:DNA polymerase III subunit alpha n=1 Tax=Clostridium botulinum TaxID=1491 RepID=UPI000774915C|nr:DNA polymerase III subunit alpha [Clostridium botulinum]MBN3367050.1 hypothetical protein [Clostridium botulinum]MBN3371686.1 hypothetical protein [Clostridium botulinum]MBN3375508.1 hypothetical protein [Clostridium botulinum]MBN3384165.1 hypothetical protein [Clostridium botulinum]MBN3402870.1 hypothetical protein [Clostridium botulinum]
MNRINTYSNLHSHDFLSILDGHSSPKEILQRCKDIGLKAVATTNHGNEFSFYYYAKLQKDFPEIKILYGVEFYEAFNHLEKNNEYKYFHFLAIAKNQRGIQAIHELITKSNFEGFYYKPRIDLEQLKPYAKDLIVSSACLGSKLGKFINDYNKCLKFVEEYKSVFKDNFYLEMQVHASENQIKYNKLIKKLSVETNTPYIITNDNHYTSKEKQTSHAYFVNINRDNQDIENLAEIYDDCYIHTVDEIYDIMKLSGLTEKEITIGLENTNKIADICNGKVEFGEPELPHIPIPKEYKNEEEWFQSLIMKGWKKKIEPNIKNDMVYDEFGVGRPIQEYKDRMLEEYNTMKDMGFLGYHLIISDYVSWAKKQGIAVADGRGSASGSFVNHLLNITGIDPIPYGLLFSRYINKERISMPDIDSDFQSNRRCEVFEYIKSKYGEDKVSQIINFTYITPKVAVKDAGRCLGKPHKDMEALAEFMTQDTIDESIENSRNNKKLLDLIGVYSDVIELAKEFDGRPRSLSINACGTVITSKPIYEYCGMMKGEEGETLLQVDKKIAEELGMVKMDLLSTKVLQIISDTMNKIGKDYYDVKKLPLDDKATYEFLAKGNLYGVFQLEGYNMTKFFMQLQPKNIMDICAGISLYRPASIKFLDDYIKFKNNPKLISYYHDDMKDILNETYSIIVYQEQIMFLLQKLAKFSFAHADLVRRGIGKKDMKYILEQKEAFIFGDKNRNILGCVNNGLTEAQAREIFDIIESAGEYCFNKSHGLSYALLTYYTAYLKCHYPLEFMTSLLSLTNDNMKISQYLTECKELGVKISHPDINESDLGFKVYDNSILYGIGSLNNVGEPTVKQIILNRPYISFQDFLDKNVFDIQENEIKFDKSALISLVNSGCFDNLPMENNDEDLPARDLLLGKIFYNSAKLITKVSTTNIVELFENNLLDKNQFGKEKRIYKLHKTLLEKKNILDLYIDDEIITSYKNLYDEDTYEIENNKLKIIKNKYTKQYDKYLKLLKENLKINSEEYTKEINKNRVIKDYLNYRKNQDDADLEFESTSFYFQDSWLKTVKDKYGVDEFKDIPNLNMRKVGYYKKKQLYIIMGTLTGKIKKHREIILLTNSGIVICKLGDILYNTVASDLKRGDKIVLNGYVGDGFFRAEYYENGRSNKLKALRVLND